jgi:PIN domain nuclease of toxin-antitoxin system
VILLDTHILFWLVAKPEKLSRAAARIIASEAKAGALAISDISLWELAALIEGGRIHVEGTSERFLGRIAERPDLTVLPISSEIAVQAARFPRDFPGDPADRIIAATARTLPATLVTRDRRLQDSQLVRTLW